MKNLVFGQKGSKNGHFGPKMAILTNFFKSVHRILLVFAIETRVLVLKKIAKEILSENIWNLTFWPFLVKMVSFIKNAPCQNPWTTCNVYVYVPVYKCGILSYQLIVLWAGLRSGCWGFGFPDGWHLLFIHFWTCRARFLSPPLLNFSIFLLFWEHF